MSDLQTSNTPAKSTWWKWIVLLPACVFGSLLGSLAIGLIQWFIIKRATDYSEDGWYFLYILPIITSATFGYLWVVISREIAPKGKKVSAIVTTTILLVIILLTIIFSLTNPSYSNGQQVQSVLGGLAMAIAAILKIINFDE